MEMINIGIIEDEEEIREDIHYYLNKQDDCFCSIAANSFEDFLKEIKKKPVPDILLADIGLPGMSGLDGIRLIKSKYPKTEIIMLTVFNTNEKILKALEAGASGYLLKDTPLRKIKEAIFDLKSGGAPMNPVVAKRVLGFFSNPQQPENQPSKLTKREKEIVDCLVEGMNYQSIAEKLQISIETIRSHIKVIYPKLEIKSKSELIRKAHSREI